MILPDVNVLVYAHREEAAQHVGICRWLEAPARSGRMKSPPQYHRSWVAAASEGTVIARPLGVLPVRHADTARIAPP